jgi:opacity protein-like surface antigen
MMVLALFVRVMVTLALATAAFGQRPSFGIKIGWPATDTFRDQSWPGGRYEASSGRWVLGPVFELMLPARLSVATEILHRSIEYRSTGSGENLVTTGHAWTLPLLGKFRLSDKWVSPLVGGGVVWQRFASLKQTGTELGGALPRQPVQVSRKDPRELRERTAKGFTVSLGLEGNLLGPRFIPEIRYTRWTTQAFAAPDGRGLNRRNQFEILLTLMF